MVFYERASGGLSPLFDKIDDKAKANPMEAATISPFTQNLFSAAIK
jgi:hypothetical protein